MQVCWLKDALSDLQNLYYFIAEDSEQAAERQLSRIRDQVEQLSSFPELGRIGRAPNTRELVISGTPFVVIYRVRVRIVHIIAVLHGARRWPKTFR